MLQFIAPPMPHYIVSGEDIYPVGGKHANRSNIGVFDLIAVNRGGLFLEEGNTALPIPAGSYAVLRPDRAHRTVVPCSEETHFYWLHFQTLGCWFEYEKKPDRPMLLDPQPYAQIEYFSFYMQRSGVIQTPGLVFDLFRHLLQLSLDPSPLVLISSSSSFMKFFCTFRRKAILEATVLTYESRRTQPFTCGGITKNRCPTSVSPRRCIFTRIILHSA